VCQFTEPAAAVGSPGAPVERKDHRPPRQERGQASAIPLLRRQLEWRCERERRRVRHQNSFTSTTWPASTMSVCAGISM
jgi:hypothetical protein